MTAAQFSKTYNRAPSHAPLVPPTPAPTQAPSLMDNIGNAAQGVSNFIGAKGIADEFGSTLAELAAPNKTVANRVEEPSLKNVVGSAIQTGANLIPGGAEVDAVKGIASPLIKTAAKVSLGAATGYGIDTGSKLQNNDPTAGQPGIVTLAGAALPVAGEVVKPGVAVLGSLLKGIGSGLSGVPVHQIEQIFNNPKAAQAATQQIAKAGKSGVLENNARTIVNGVGQIRQEARKAFGDALGTLKSEDINPQTFRQAIQPVLEKVGSVLDPKTNTRTLNNVEFGEQKNLDKAGKLIDEVSKTPLDGLSLRNLISKIDDAKYKTATSDERLSFNAFLNDLGNGVKGAVNSSTDKLKDINTKFSNDMQLAEATQQIFGKVQFKNLPEVVKASQKLENLFSQKGLAPEVTNDFLKRIGVDPDQFKTTEAVRQLSGKEGGANSVGLSLGEVARSVTSAVVSPEMVGTIAAKTGMAKEVVEPFLKGLGTQARNAVLQALAQSGQTGEAPTQ